MDGWSYVNSRLIPILADILLKHQITDKIIAVYDRTVRVADEIFWLSEVKYYKSTSYGPQFP